MWDTIGGNGCYEELLEIAKEVGKETKARIHMDYREDQNRLYMLEVQ